MAGPCRGDCEARQMIQLGAVIGTGSVVCLPRAQCLGSHVVLPHPVGSMKNGKESMAVAARHLEMGRKFWYTGENPQKMGKGRIFL